MSAAESLKRLPFDLYGRYRLAADVVERIAGDRRLAVLDVGGGPLSIEGFLPEHRVVASDLRVPSHWHTPSPNLILADGAQLPFDDGAFDVVVTLDTLEHVPADRRAALLAESLRVSKGWLFAACPCATPGVAEADAAVLSYVRARFGEEFDTVSVLTEHLSFGHPDPAGIEDALAAMGAEVARLPSGRLDRWLPMTLLFYDLMALGRDDPVERVQAWYNQLLTYDDRREPSYRQAFVARRGDAEGASLADVVDGLVPQAPSELEDVTGFDAVRAVLETDVADLAEDRRRRIEVLEAELAQAHQEIATLTARAEAAEVHVAALLEFRDRVLRHPAVRLRRRIRRPLE